VDVPKADLPKDAIFKGYREVVVQNIKLTTDNVKFLICRYWSPSEKRTIEGKLSDGFDRGEFGPDLVAFAKMLYYQGRVPHKKIQKILEGFGVQISETHLSRILNSVDEALERELKRAQNAGIAKAEFAQTDDTGARIMGFPGHTIVVSNPYFSNYTTLESKRRLSVLKALTGREELLYRINRVSLTLLKGKLAKKHKKVLERIKGNRVYREEEFFRKILGRDAYKKLAKKNKDDIQIACAIASYRYGDMGPTCKTLISDDATNFKNITQHHGLCWIHELRHYRLLSVYGSYFEKIYQKFMDRAWKLYRRLKRYKAKDLKEKKAIEEEFDDLFETETDFKLLNELFPNTRKRRKGLLLVLEQPNLPIHNNESETDLRERVLKRKISYGNRSWEGVKSWDVHLSLMGTCRKNKVVFWEYLKDRQSGSNQIPQLDKIIQSAA